MSKFHCKCGFVISDVEYPSSSNGTIFSCESMDMLISFSGDAMEILIKHSGDNRQLWLNEKFGKQYPADASDVEILEDLVAIHSRAYSRSVINCVSCGRLHIQSEPGSNSYTSYVPEARKS